MGHDTQNGGAGTDTIVGDTGDASLTGGTGSDAFFLSAGEPGQVVVTDFAAGEDYLDFAAISSLTDRLALAGVSSQQGTNVLIQIDATHSIVLQNTTTEQLATANIGFAQITGTDGNDILIGTAGANFMSGLGGADVMSGLAGSDSMFGGTGNDTLNGGDDSDYLSGDAGNDALDGGLGPDTAAFLFSGQITGAVVNLSTGVASNDGAGGTDTLVNIENVSGSSFGDDIAGNADNNILSGLDGNDSLRGGAGNDGLYGNGGNDTLIGGAGSDVLVGGAGDDLFVFGNGDGTDTVADFAPGHDIIDISQVSAIDSFAQLLAATNDDAIGNTVIDLGGGNTLFLSGVTESQLHTNDFLF